MCQHNASWGGLSINLWDKLARISALLEYGAVMTYRSNLADALKQA